MKFQLKNLISLRPALMGAILMGTIVFFINQFYGYQAAAIAALKQAAYTFFLGGAVIRLGEYISTRFQSFWKGVILGTSTSSLLAIVLVYIVHLTRGTPLPFESTLPTILLGPPGFLVLIYLYRNKKKN